MIHRYHYSKRYLEVTGQPDEEFEVDDKCGCGLCETDYLCTTTPLPSDLAAMNRSTKFHHVHVSNVEPCSPDPAQGPEPFQGGEKPCAAAPTGDHQSPRSAPLDTDLGTT